MDCTTAILGDNRGFQLFTRYSKRLQHDMARFRAQTVDNSSISISRTLHLPIRGVYDVNISKTIRHKSCRGNFKCPVSQEKSPHRASSGTLQLRGPLPASTLHGEQRTGEDWERKGRARSGHSHAKGGTYDRSSN